GIRAGHVTGVQTCALPICPLVQHRRAALQRDRLPGPAPFPPPLSEVPPPLRHVDIRAAALPPQSMFWGEAARARAVRLAPRVGRSEERRVGREGRWWWSAG